jgi:hypothetical protein
MRGEMSANERDEYHFDALSIEDEDALAMAMCKRLAADEAKPGDPLSDLARIDDARFVPDERGGHIWWNGMKWRPE